MPIGPTVPRVIDTAYFGFSLLCCYRLGSENGVMIRKLAQYFARLNPIGAI